MDFEYLNDKIGGCGRYQYITFFLLSLTTFKYSGDLQSLTFALFVPKFQCVVENNRSIDHHYNASSYISKDQCQYRDSLNTSWKPCTKWNYNKDVLIDSFITDYNLICKKEYYREMMFSVYFFGSLVSYIFIIFTDMIGRRVALIICLFLSAINSFSQTIIYSLWAQYVLTFICGYSRTIFTCLAFSTLIELLPSNKIDIAATNFWIPYSLSYMAAALFAFLGRSWKYITWFNLVLAIFYFFYFCFVPETPRWLMLNKKREKSLTTMAFIAKINGRQFSKTDFDDWTPIEEKTGKFWNLFKHKVMVIRLLILNFAAWSFAFAYIGSSTDLTFASNNIFITTFVSGLIELFACPVAGLLANKFGRKRPVMGLCFLGIVCLILLPFLEPDLSKSIWQPWLKLVIAMGSKFGFVGGWAVFDIIISEIMPTAQRNAAMSMIYMAVGLGSIVAPMIHNLAMSWYHAAPCLLYSILLIGTVILVKLLIPETHTLPIPQTIEQSISLIINKEQEWKADMIMQANKLGMSSNNQDNCDTHDDMVVSDNNHLKIFIK